MSSYNNSVSKINEGVGKFFNKVFSNIIIEGPALDLGSIHQDPVMIVCTHRSHIDYFLLGWILFNKGLVPLRFAAGDNLTKLPWIGPKFKALGAFTVEREKGFEKKYVRNLCNQVIGMLENQDKIIVFPEGGRSYTGSLLDVKSGVLGAAVLLQASDMSRNVRILPVAISYDFSPDAAWFKLLLKGKSLRKKSNPFFKRLLGSFYYFGADLMAFGPFIMKGKSKLSKSNYGSVYIDYQNMVSVKDLVDINAMVIPDARDNFSAHRNSMQHVSVWISKIFKNLFRILPHHLVAHALQQKSSSLEEIETTVQKIVAVLESKQLNTKSIQAKSSKELVQNGLDLLIKNKTVVLTDKTVKIVNIDRLRYFAAIIESNDETTATV